MRLGLVLISAPPILSIPNLLCGQTQYIMTLGNWNGYHSYKRREGGGSTSLVKLQYCTEALQLQMGPHSDDWNVQKIPFEIGY